MTTLVGRFARLLPAVVVLGLVAGVLTAACSGASGETNSANGACSTQAEGCPCANLGEQHACGELLSRAADHVTCAVGTRACTAAGWGSCSQEHVSQQSTESASIDGVRPMGLGNGSPCVDNPCNPDCMTVTDTPNGLSSEGGVAFSEAGITISPADGSSVEGGLSVLGCSADLHYVTDANGVIIQTCSNSQGCANGACVPACDAAASSHGAVGCDFSLPTPAFYAAIKSPCHAAFVANNWPLPVQITATRGGVSYNLTTFARVAQSGVAETSWPKVPVTGLPSGQVAVLFLSQDPASVNGTPLTCPITPAINQTYGAAVTGSGSGSVTARGTAWRITGDYPISVYDIMPYGGAKSYLPSASLIFPTTAWGASYYGIVPKRGSQQPQWGQVVAANNNTTVTVVPNVNLPSGAGVIAAPANATTTYTLQANEYIQWEESNEMSGTVISANQPVAFFGGQGYNCYSSATSSGGGCDSAHQQMPPISAFGSTYVAPPYRSRYGNGTPESIFYRFVGAANGTTLSYDPAVAGAPTTLAKGQVVDFQTTLAFVARAQDSAHAFYMGQVMSGCLIFGTSRPGCFGGATCYLGDEEYVNIPPPAQFLNSYVFFTDPTYPTTNLVFTRVKVGGVFKDVTLDCYGTLGGWTNVGAAADYQITNVDVKLGGSKVGACDNGPRSATSAGPFGVMVWGLDYFSSYAYAAGGNLANINTISAPPPYQAPAYFIRDYDGVCPVGKTPYWRWFDFGSNPPGDSSISFSAQTAATQAGLGAATPYAVNGPIKGATNLPWTGAGDLETIFPPGEQSREFVRITMKLSPSSDMKSTPTLTAWRQLYDCRDKL